ncbi:NucA/NucB deoxyribonuclease domain-containing protein [Spirillospora sp. NPDC127200]
MKRVSRLLAAMASLTLTATLTLGAPPVAAASPEPDAAQRGFGAAEMPTAPNTPPAGTEWLNNCLGSSDAQDPDGRVYNRFRWCQQYTLESKYSVRNVLKGINKITFEAAAIGFNDSRATRVFFRAKTGSVKYEKWSPLDQRLEAPNLKLEVTPECVPGANQPTTATCGVGRSPAKMEWAQWSNSTHWSWWDVSSVGGQGLDQVAFHKWRIHFTGKTPGYDVTARGEGIPNGIRCDSGDYFKHGVKSFPHACIYTNAYPVLTYKMSENPQVGQHIRDAQDNPDSTWPKKPKDGLSKRIPGKWHVSEGLRGAPLHRVPSRYEGGVIADENEEWKKSACGQKGGLNPWAPHYDARTGLPPYPSGLQCDEYPFSSTDEGASDPKWDFSVRAVDASDNTSAGSKLRGFYTDDRILMFLDDFWVNVVDA